VADLLRDAGRFSPKNAFWKAENDSPDLQAVQKRVLDLQIGYQEVARPFSWKFTRKDLKEKLKLVSEHIIEQHQPVTVTYQAPTIENFPL
jgi:hypothetical protein